MQIWAFCEWRAVAENSVSWGDDYFAFDLRLGFVLLTQGRITRRGRE